MNDISPVIYFVIAVNTVIFLLMMVWVRFFQKGAEGGISKKANVNSRLEQRLVLEAISACALEPGLKDIIFAVGNNAAEKTGFPFWMIWLREGNDDFHLADFFLGSNNIIDLQGVREEQLITWVKQNPEPVETGPFLQEMCKNQKMKQAVSLMGGGLLIPFNDGQHLLGFIILGGKKNIQEKRSADFLSLYGAFASIIIRKTIADARQRALEKEQLRADSLANLGKLAAGMAHEIRNPLTFMKAAMQQLQKKFKLPDSDSGLSEGIVEEIDRINKHVQDLLNLGRIDPVEFSRVSAKTILLKAVGFISSQAEEMKIECQVVVPDDDLIIMGNPDLLWQIILNLLLNGLDAIGENGNLDLICSRQGKMFSLKVKDSGCGISEENSETIFDPFFTTKDHGTGLGLSTAYNIAKAHGGSLSLKETGPEGTVFELIIPLAD